MLSPYYSSFDKANVSVLTWAIWVGYSAGFSAFSTGFSTGFLGSSFGLESAIYYPWESKSASLFFGLSLSLRLSISFYSSFSFASFSSFYFFSFASLSSLSFFSWAILASFSSFSFFPSLPFQLFIFSQQEACRVHFPSFKFFVDTQCRLKPAELGLALG